MKKQFRLKNRIQRIMIIIVIVLAIIGTFIIELRTNPRFGGKINSSKAETYNKSPNYKDGEFVNTNTFPSHMQFSFKDLREGIGELISPQANTKPNMEIPVVKAGLSDIVNFKQGTRLFWFGHSTCLLQTANKTILLDPMFSDVPSPYSWLGSARFNTTLPISIEKLPQIDAVIISHDHYDHLDYGSIQMLKRKVQMFYVPLGLGVHLEKWGIEKERISELDWWEDIHHDGLVLNCLPAQHFSGRKPNTSNSTLWCSWAIKSHDTNIYFSGDSGYSEHFKAIGEKFGPFDFALMECGQYNEKWPHIHMFPEQSVKAGVDLQAQQIMPIHWGAFRLSQHAWNEPVERFLTAAQAKNIQVVIPKIGESVFIPSRANSDIDTWWRKH